MSSQIQTKLSEKEYVEKVNGLKEKPAVLNKIYKDVLQINVDYGTIPGTPKPSLWKPGAELLGIYFHLTTGNTIIEKTEDISKPYFSYVVQQRFFFEGKLVSVGVGASNTGESRYALRKVYELDYQKMADEEKAKVITKKTSKGIQYYLPTPPDEIFTLQNTVLKMAKKRAFVDGILSATGADRIFTQDLSEEDEDRVANAKPVNQTK
jgi:hypothetical protein